MQRYSHCRLLAMWLLAIKIIDPVQGLSLRFARRVSQSRSFPRWASRQPASPSPSSPSAPSSAAEERRLLLDELVKPEPTDPVLMQWKPQRRKLLFRWRGTMLHTSLATSLAVTALSVGVCTVAFRSGVLHGIGLPIETATRTIQSLARLEQLWQLQSTILTFFLAFYVNTARSLFERVLAQAREVQYRIADVQFVVASHAIRTKQQTITEATQTVVERVGRYGRLLPVLLYAAHSLKYEPLLVEEETNDENDNDNHDDALRDMRIHYNLLTRQEESLLRQLPVARRYDACLVWMMASITQGCEAGSLHNDANFASLLRLQDLRTACSSMIDLTATRCHLAYVHLVQVLVDSYLLITPFATLGKLGWYSIGGTFLISFFFTGLVNLAKTFLDPLNNDEYSADDVENVNIDTLVQETNRASRRYAAAGQTLPWAVAEPQDTNTDGDDEEAARAFG